MFISMGLARLVARGIEEKIDHIAAIGQATDIAGYFVGMAVVFDDPFTAVAFNELRRLIR